MPLLLALGPLLVKGLRLLLKPLFNKYVRKALSSVFGPVWNKVGKPIWRRTGLPIWQRTGAPIWQKLWHDAPQKEKAKKQFDTVTHCPGCEDFTVTRVERYGTNRVLLKVVPGPAVGPRQFRAVCDNCSHERPVRVASIAAGAARAVAVEPGGSMPPIVLEPVPDTTSG